MHEREAAVDIVASFYHDQGRSFDSTNEAVRPTASVHFGLNLGCFTAGNELWLTANLRIELFGRLKRHYAHHQLQNSRDFLKRSHRLTLI